MQGRDLNRIVLKKNSWNMEGGLKRGEINIVEMG